MVGKLLFKERKTLKKRWDLPLKTDLYDKLFSLKFWGVKTEIYWWSVLHWNWIIIVNNFSDTSLNTVYFRSVKGINCSPLPYNYNEYHMTVTLARFDMLMVNICRIRTAIKFLYRALSIILKWHLNFPAKKKQQKKTARLLTHVNVTGERWLMLFFSSIIKQERFTNRMHENAA